VSDDAAVLLLIGDRVDAAAICRGLDEVQMPARCDEARSTADAIAKLEASPFDCAIIDHASLDEALAMVAAVRDAAPTVPVLLIGPSDPASEARVFASDATDTIPREDLSPVRLARRVRFVIRSGRAEAQAEAVLARSQASEAARGEILSVVAHDLRSPLNAISLACEALSDEVTTEQRQRYVAAIRRAAARAEKLLRDLLDVSHIESGTLEVHTRAVPVASILQQAKSDHVVDGVELAIALDDSAAAASAMCDKDRMLQLLGNLIGNATKFAPKTPITLGARAGADSVEIFVADRGPGIDPSILPRVFDRYWQARQHNRAGAGLGLTIARGIAEAMGGTIRAENDGGATIIVRLARAT